jgi:hypothetical protein
MTEDEEKRLDEAGKILAKGGILYVSPDILAAIERTAESVTTVGSFGVRIIASKYMPPNTWAALAPMPDLYIQQRAWYVEPSSHD